MTIGLTTGYGLYKKSYFYNNSKWIRKCSSTRNSAFTINVEIEVVLLNVQKDGVELGVVLENVQKKTLSTFRDIVNVLGFRCHG